MTRESARAELEAAGAQDPAAKRSQATELVDLGASLELFRFDDEGYAIIPDGGRAETWPLRSKRFRDWLARAFYIKHKRAAGAQALEDALRVLTGRALYECAERTVHVRIAGRTDEILIDMCDEAWRAIRVTPGGWSIVEQPQIHFLRRRGMQALPEPVRGGSFDELWSVLNVRPGPDRILLLGVLIQALRPTGPYPVCLLQGEHGAAKTSAARILRALVDPNLVPTRSPPKNETDLLIAARNSWLLVYDNLSGVPDWQSDAFCRLSTGGGYSARELYSDADEILIDVQRPMILNGIDDLATRGDLADRSVPVTLEPIAETDRITEKVLWERFARVRPRVLGALLDALVVALRRHGEVKLPRLPRMADFCLWATAAEPALGLADGEFLSIYTAARHEAVSNAIESSTVGRLLREFLENLPHWRGTSAELLDAVAAMATDQQKLGKGWPRSPRGMSAAVTRWAPVLRQLGIKVEKDRTGHGRDRIWIFMREVAAQPSAERNRPRHDETSSENKDMDASTARTDARTVAADRANRLHLPSASESNRNKDIATPPDGPNAADGSRGTPPHNDDLEAF